MFQYRYAADVVRNSAGTGPQARWGCLGARDIGQLLLRTGSGKAKHGPLLVPAKRQT